MKDRIPLQKGDPFSQATSFGLPRIGYTLRMMERAKTAVQFGAGQIGRGFTGALFHESHYRLVFVEAVKAIADQLNAQRGYTLRIVGDNASEIWIDDLSALFIEEEDRIAEALAEAEVACTAVGVGAMNAIAPLIAKGIACRHRSGNFSPLNVLICENQLHGDQLLREAVRQHLPDALHAYLDETIGFALCVVSRMVPIATEEERKTLTVRAEAYKTLPVDRSALKGDAPPVVGLLPVDQFDAYIERKLFMHNASHAILAYLGAEKGYEFGWQALEDPQVRKLLEEAMRPIAEAMTRKHGFSRSDLAQHLKDLFRRYANRDLGDTVFRLARDPMRKLRPDDRLIGAAKLVQSEHLNPSPLCRAIAAALRFSASDDPSAVELQTKLQKEGIDETLRQVCGLEADAPLAQCIKRFYHG